MTPAGRQFGGEENTFSDYGSARAVILPIPYEGTVSYGKGASLGPEAILNASVNLEFYDEELQQETLKTGIHTLPPVPVKEPSEAMMSAIKEAALKPMRDGKFVAAIGGEHSVTKGVVDALIEAGEKDFGVLQLDAHADLRDAYHDTPFSHACIMRRIDEMDLPYTQVGIRSLSVGEAEFIESRGRKIYYAHEIKGRMEWVDEVLDHLPEKVYITIDIDCLDPSIMPSTGTPEPGGLDWYTVTTLLKKVTEEKKVIGLDLVELAPIEGLHAPDFLAAKLLYRLLGYIFRQQP